MSEESLDKYSPRLILASGHAGRAGLLREEGYRFFQADTSPEAPATKSQWPPKHARALSASSDWGPSDAAGTALCLEFAERKARGLADTGHPRIRTGAHTIIMTAQSLNIDDAGDAVVAPRDKQDAAAMLGRLAQHGQRVVVAVYFLQPDSLAFASIADTFQIKLSASRSAVDRYLNSDAWQDQPGGVSLSNPPDGWGSEVIGDPTVLLGLPMAKLGPALANWSIVPTAQG